MSQISQNMRGAAILGFIPFLQSKYESIKSTGAKNKYINKQACKVQHYLQKRNYKGKKHDTSQQGTITGYPGTPTSFENL